MRFFDHSRLLVLRTQIVVKEKEVVFLKNTYEEKLQTSDRIADELREAKNRISDLEVQRKSKQITKMQKNAEITEVTLTDTRFKAELEKLVSKMEVAKQTIEETRNREKSKITDRMQIILREIEECDDILKQPAPQPGWRTGRFCKNGHENCVNIPNDQIRTIWLPPTEQEIFQYEEKKRNAHILKEKLENEYNQLQQEYKMLEEGFSSSSEYQTAVSNLNECQKQIEIQQQKIAENEELSEQKQQEYNDLLEGENQLHDAIEKIQITANNLSSDLTNLESEIAAARTQWMDAELQLQNLTEQLQQMQYEAENRRMSDSISPSMLDPAMEQAQHGQSANNSNLTPTMLEGLKRLAQQEIQEEMGALNQTAQNVTQTAKNLATPVTEGINKIKEIVRGVEIKDLYPYPGAAMTKLIMNKVEEIMENPTKEDPNNVFLTSPTNNAR